MGREKEKQTLNNKKGMEKKQKEKFKFKETHCRVERGELVRATKHGVAGTAVLSLSLSILFFAQIVTDHRKGVRGMVLNFEYGLFVIEAGLAGGSSGFRPALPTLTS